MKRLGREVSVQILQVLISSITRFVDGVLFEFPTLSTVNSIAWHLSETEQRRTLQLAAVKLVFNELSFGSKFTSRNVIILELLGRFFKRTTKTYFPYHRNFYFAVSATLFYHEDCLGLRYTDLRIMPHRLVQLE